jgi:KRAB domain-containing zinc finger protein
MKIKEEVQENLSAVVEHLIMETNKSEFNFPNSSLSTEEPLPIFPNNIKEEPEQNFFLILPRAIDDTFEEVGKEVKENVKKVAKPERKRVEQNLMRKHVNKGKWGCDLCGEFFTQKCKLKSHVLIHLSFGLFECFECGNRFKTERTLKKHVKCMSRNICDICSDVFKCRFALLKHRLSHRSEGKENDKKKMKEKLSRETKKRVKKPIFENESCEASRDCKNFQCDICGNRLKTRKSMHNHLKRHFQEKTFKCKDCGKGFRTRSHLERHENFKKAVKCKVCSFEMKCQYGLQQHEKIHEKDLKCSQCSYVTTKIYLLKMHKRIHEKRLKCETCGDSFSFPSFLKSHQLKKQHGIYAKGDQEIHSCDKCDSRFRDPARLKLHVRLVHDVSKVFNCNQCTKIFKNKSYLYTHLQTHIKVPCPTCNKIVTKRFHPTHVRQFHTESQEYHCDLCGYQFNKRNNIKSHMAKIHPNSEFVCVLCREKFSTVHELFKHKRVHIGKSQYKCLKCGSILPSNFYLKRHEVKCR